MQACTLIRILRLLFFRLPSSVCLLVLVLVDVPLLSARIALLSVVSLFAAFVSVSSVVGLFPFRVS